MSEYKGTIWIINHYASHLETRHLELAKSFASQGYKVAVVTSSFHHGRHEYLYNSKVQFVAREENVLFVYLRSTPAYSSNGGRRILNMINFCLLFSHVQNDIAKRAGRPDYVIGSSAHPFVWESAWTCARKYQAKFIAELRDIWPLSLIQVQKVNPRHPFVVLLGIIEKRSYLRADAIVSTMEHAYRHIYQVAKVPYEKVHWMPNGINIERTDAAIASNKDLPTELTNYMKDHWCCVYTGSIARCEHIDYLVEAFRQISDPEISLAIIGDGGHKTDIQRMISNYKLDNVRMFPALSKELVPLALQKAHCCVSVIPDLPLYQYGLSMNKLNDYLYSGKPVVFACNANNIVKTAGHFAIDYGNPVDMAKTIEMVKTLPPERLAVLEEAGKNLVREHYDIWKIGKRYLEMMENL